MRTSPSAPALIHSVRSSPFPPPCHRPEEVPEEARRGRHAGGAGRQAGQRHQGEAGHQLPLLVGCVGPTWAPPRCCPRKSGLRRPHTLVAPSPICQAGCFAPVATTALLFGSVLKAGALGFPPPLFRSHPPTHASPAPPPQTPPPRRRDGADARHPQPADRAGGGAERAGPAPHEPGPVPLPLPLQAKVLARQGGHHDCAGGARREGGAGRARALGRCAGETKRFPPTAAEVPARPASRCSAGRALHARASPIQLLGPRLPS